MIPVKLVVTKPAYWFRETPIFWRSFHRWGETVKILGTSWYSAIRLADDGNSLSFITITSISVGLVTNTA
jgi:hypothetical protein